MGAHSRLIWPPAPTPASPATFFPLAAEKGIDWRGAGWWAGCMAGPAGFFGRGSELSRLLGALGGDARLLLAPDSPADAPPPAPGTPSRHSFTAGDLS